MTQISSFPGVSDRGYPAKTRNTPLGHHCGGSDCNLCLVSTSQSIAASQIDAGLKRSLISFASARTLNGLISVVQGTEFSVQPLVIGVTLTIGQILDPINDLVEQFSSLMLLASVIFGLQKVLLVIGGHWMVSTLICAFAATWALLIWFSKAPAWMSRVILVLLVVRFAIPVITWGSDFVFQQLLAKEYQEHQAALDVSVKEVGGLTPQKVPATAAPVDQTLMGRLRERVESSIPNVSINYEAIKNSVARLPERIVRLTVIFIAQTIVLPLILFWALYALVLGVIRPSRRS